MPPADRRTLQEHEAGKLLKIEKAFGELLIDNGTAELVSDDTPAEKDEGKKAAKTEPTFDADEVKTLVKEAVAIMTILSIGRKALMMEQVQMMLIITISIEQILLMDLGILSMIQ